MLVRLEARGFRNLQPLELELGEGFHLITGPNGAGKTSLLEAFYLLATTRSFRAPLVQHCCRHGGRSFALAGEVRDNHEQGVRTRLELSWQDGQRRRSRNGQETSLAEHLAVLPVVAWTARDVDVLIGTPAERRRFLDRGVVGRRPAALGVISRYRQALTEKRQLLHRSTSASATVGAVEYETWNRVLATAAAELALLRDAYVRDLSAALADLLAACGLDLPPIELVYRPSPAAAREGVERIFAAIVEQARREIATKSALVGPHRDDLRILWDGHEARRVASAGERKAIGLLLTAAHGEVLRQHGREATFLLDDADTELDRGRLEGVWKVLGGARQTIATSNRPAVWEDVAGRRLSCAAGSFSE